MRPRMRLRVLALLLACSFPRTAHAQPKEPPAGDATRGSTGGGQPPAVTVIKPSVRFDPGAQYPRKALDDGVKERVEVTLIVDVDATGKVTDVHVDQGAGHGF